MAIIQLMQHRARWVFPKMVHFRIPMRRFYAVASSLALTYFLLLTSCASFSPLTVASHMWPGYEFIFYARQQGWLPSEEIHIVETASASESLQDLLEGRVEAATLTLDEVLRGREQHLPLTIVLILDISAGADVLLVQPGITDLTQLKGKRIGVETSALGDLMLNRILGQAHLLANEVQVVPVTFDAQLATWQAGKLDAVISYEPLAHQLEALGAERLFDSRQLPNTIFDVLAVRSDKLDQHAQQVKQLIQGHFRGLHAWKTNPIDSEYRFARHLQVAAEEVPLLYRGLELPDIDYNRRLLNAPAKELYNTALEIQTMMKWSSNLDNLFTADFLAEVTP